MKKKYAKFPDIKQVTSVVLLVYLVIGIVLKIKLLRHKNKVLTFMLDKKNIWRRIRLLGRNRFNDYIHVSKEHSQVWTDELPLWQNSPLHPERHPVSHTPVDLLQLLHVALQLLLQFRPKKFSPHSIKKFENGDKGFCMLNKW